MMKLYSYYRSSASYRARIALEVKSIPYEYLPVHLVRDGGQQHQSEYTELNPMAQVPTLVHDDLVLGQSMAIVQYLDRIYPNPRLFPEDHVKRAQVIEFCEIINSGIQPLQNLNTTQKLEEIVHATADERKHWVIDFVSKGLKALEKRLEASSGKYCFGDHVTAADVFLCPQVYSAKRFDVGLENYPNIMKVEKNCLDLEPFQAAYPAAQPDTPEE